MTDERIDALIRRLDVAYEPDPAFVRDGLVALMPLAQAARVRDADRVGRLRRDIRLRLRDLASPSFRSQRRTALLVVALVVLAMVGVIVAGSVRRILPFQGGPLVFSNGGDLQVLDSPLGPARSILPIGVKAQAISRSPDGRLIAFWATDPDRTRLYVAGVDGRDRHEVGQNLTLGFTNAIDTWSADSRFLATEAVVENPPLGISRIVVLDVVTGVGRVLTPPGLVAHDPLWSPDGQWIAFDSDAAGKRPLFIVRIDGSDIRTMSGTLTSVAGPDTWSPDGRWIYFGSQGHVYRVDVASGVPEKLTGDVTDAWAPASSPDGTLVAFMRHRATLAGWDLHIANSDGTGDHRVLEWATNDGWSTDGRFVLTEWTPPGQPGGLAIVPPDGSSVQILVPFSDACRMVKDPRQTCLEGVGWGEPRP